MNSKLIFQFLAYPLTILFSFENHSLAFGSEICASLRLLESYPHIHLPFSAIFQHFLSLLLQFVVYTSAPIISSASHVIPSATLFLIEGRQQAGCWSFPHL